MVNPSGYCGAMRKINQTGRINVGNKAREATATIIREGRLIFFITYFVLKTSRC
jgi:hypothetical protein